MNPFGWLISQGGQTIFDEGRGLHFGEVLFADVSALFTGDIFGNSAGGASVTGALSVERNLAGSIVGTSIAVAQLTVGTAAGFEIPYLLGLGLSATPISLIAAGILGRATVIGNLTQINQLSSTIAGLSTVTGNLSRSGGDVLAGVSNGTSTVTGELYVNAIRELAGTINGSSTVEGSIWTALVGFDPRNQSYLYLFVNVGVGFDPTDTYPGGTQTFPDGHTRDDFSRYLYLLLNVGVGFDPTDDVSSRPDFFSQTFPYGHTAFDFHEYLYLYLNVVRGFNQQGQLIIRPGYTRGPILPGAKPPKYMNT